MVFLQSTKISAGTWFSFMMKAKIGQIQFLLRGPSTGKF